MDDSSKRKATEPAADGTATNRRRVGLVVHDDRGMGSIEWRDAPAGEERTVLEVLGNPPLAVQNDAESYDPYARHSAPKTTPGNTTRTDLRKLSEWIKMKRELEARKLRGDDEEEEDSG